MRGNGPYAQAARKYLTAGWGSPLPLPAGKKKSPPDGWTGRTAPEASAAEVEAWCEQHPDGNIAMRLSQGIIGIDVDAHKSEQAAKAWEELTARYGPLPNHAPWCTSRDDGISGIRLFRVPENYVAVGVMGPAGEVIQRHHRYVVVPPSVSPPPPLGTGKPYRWVNLDNGHVPQREDLPVLPTAWQEALRAGAIAAQPEGIPAGSTWTDPDIDALAAHGIPDGANQDEYLRDLVFKLASQGVTRAATRAVWLTVLSRTRLTRPSQPWTDADFDRHWRGAAAKTTPETGEPTFQAVSLTALIRDGVPQPELLPGDLLYLSGIHLVSGEPDSGKTTFCLWQLLGLLRTGRAVLMLDEEGGPDMTAEKLIALGATEADVIRLHYVPFPASTWTGEQITELRAMVTGIDPAMILIDSCAAFMARAGLDENSAADVTGWWSRLLTPLAREHGCAVVVIDHDVKNGSGSRFSRGSGAKLAASDVMIKIDLVRPFSRTQNGVLKLTITKDRRGWLHRWWDVQVRTENGLSLLLSEGLEHPPGNLSDLSPASQKVLNVLNDEPVAIGELRDRLQAVYGHRLARQTISGCLNELAKLELADRFDQGPGRNVLWTSNRRSDLSASQTGQISATEGEPYFR